MKKLLIATRNPGKLPELVAMLNGAPFEFVSLNDVPELPQDYEVEEPAATFEGNAIIKAMTYAYKTGLLTLADDSGLEVDALPGQLGVYSKRFADGTNSDRCDRLLEAMRDIPDDKREAQFRCVAAICDPETGKVRTCEGVWRGQIIREKRGQNGFGYDPVFLNPEFNKVNAELSTAEKNSVSHRGQALEKARQILLADFAAA